MFPTLRRQSWMINGFLQKSGLCPKYPPFPFVSRLHSFACFGARGCRTSRWSPLSVGKGGSSLIVETDDSVNVYELRLRPHVHWTEDTVDNEHMHHRRSKSGSNDCLPWSSAASITSRTSLTSLRHRTRRRAIGKTAVIYQSNSMYHICCCVGNQMKVMRTKRLLSMWWRGGLAELIERAVGEAWNALISVPCCFDKSGIMQPISHTLCKNIELNMLHSDSETKRQSVT